MSNNIDRQYSELVDYILHFGIKKQTRNGEVLSTFGWQIRHRMSEGFPLLTTKKMAFKTMVIELLWFLRGDTSIEYLLENDCNIWNGDAYKSFHNKFPETEMMSKEEFINKIKTDNEFANKFGNLGPIYGKQWRRWDKIEDDGMQYGISEIDQIANLISELKTNPDSRRLMVSAWNVGELDQMVLPPCHYGFQVYTRELSHQERSDLKNSPPYKYGKPSNGKLIDEILLDSNNVPKRAISLMYNTRSQDVPLGTPFNIASYALLLMMIAKQVNMVPDELITNMGDCHIYLNQIDGVKEQLTRTPYELPTVEILGDVDDIANYEIDDIILKGYQSHPPIKIPLSN